MPFLATVARQVAFIPLFALLSIVVGLACTQSEVPVSPTPTMAPTPDIGATVAMSVQQAIAAMTTPTPTATPIPTATPTPTAEEIVRRSSLSAVQIMTDNGFGSGFIVDSNGGVITNAHVVAGVSKVIVRVYPKQAVSPDPPLHHALVPVYELKLGQSEQVLGMIHTLGGALGRQLPVFPEEAGQLQLLQMMLQ